MKWLLVMFSVNTGSLDYCADRPFPLLKYSEMYDTESECEQAFHDATFYRPVSKSDIVGFCLPVKPLMLSPHQLMNLAERPICKR